MDVDRERMWRVADVVLVREVLRECEETLRAQTQVAIAADQRAMQIVAASTTLGAGLLAAVVAWTSVKGWDLSLAVGLAVGEGLLAAAVAMAAYAARPQPFNLAGTSATLWKLADFHRPEALTLGAQADHYGAMIGENEASSARNGRFIMRALWLFGASPFVAGIAGGLTAWAVAAGVVAAWVP